MKNNENTPDEGYPERPQRPVPISTQPTNQPLLPQEQNYPIPQTWGLSMDGQEKLLAKILDHDLPKEVIDEITGFMTYISKMARMGNFDGKEIEHFKWRIRDHFRYIMNETPLDKMTPDFLQDLKQLRDFALMAITSSKGGWERELEKTQIMSNVQTVNNPIVEANNPRGGPLNKVANALFGKGGP